MEAPAPLPQVPIQKIFERIFKLRQVTRIDQRLLMSALSAKDSLNKEEQTLLHRVCDGLLKGALWVGD